MMWKAQKAEYLCVISNLARKYILTVSGQFCNHTPGLKIQHEGCIDQIRINLLDPDFPIFEADSWDGPSRFVSWAVLGIGYTFRYWQVTDWRGGLAGFLVC